MLYDLKADPFELKNIYSPDLSVVKKMQPSLEQWLKKTKDGFVLDKK